MKNPTTTTSTQANFKQSPQTCFPFLLALLFFTTSLSAASSIRGLVLDEQDEPLAFASVLLLQASDSSLVKGVITNEVGVFTLDQVSQGHYLLSTSMIGYTTKYSALEINNESQQIDLPSIHLEENVADLEEVVVKARKPLFEQQIDRMVINVQHSITSTGSTALDILERSPGIIVNRENGSISMSGKSGVAVMMNGRLNRMPMSSLIQILGGMPASNIEKIELITTPPANFDAEGDAGFINIILKKNENEGLNGNATATYGQGREGRSKMISGINLNFRKNKINLYGDYTFTRNRMIGLIDGSRALNYAGNTVETVSSTRRDGGFNLDNARLGLDYYLSPKTVIGVLATVFERRWSQESVNYAAYRHSSSPDSTHIGYRDDVNNSHQYLFNINLQHNFSKGQSLNFDIDYFDYDAHQPQSYDNRFYDEREQLSSMQGIRIDKTTPLQIWVSKLDYRIELNNNMRLETGLKTTQSDFKNDIFVEFNDGDEWVVNPTFTESATFDENISAGYASLDLKINKKLALKAGLRYEHTDMNLESRGENEAIIRKYGNFFPSVFLSNTLNEDQSLQLAYSRRITRPQFNELAPFVLFLEPNTYITGNSFLVPSITDQVKMAYRFKTILLSLQYSLDNDAISRFQPKIDPESNLLVYYSENIDKRETYALSLSLPVYINQSWEMQNQLTVSKMDVNSDFNDAALRFSQNSLDLNTTHTFRLPKSFTFEIVGSYRSPRLRGITFAKASGGIDLGLQKKLKGNGGTFSFNVSDIFRTKVMRWSTEIPELNLLQDSEIRFDTRVARLTYTRSFGNQKVKKGRKRQTGAADELRRVTN